MSCEAFEFQALQGDDAIDEERTDLKEKQSRIWARSPRTLEEELAQVRAIIHEDWEQMEASIRYLADR